MAAQVTGSAIEVASLGDAFGAAVQAFGASNETLVSHLERIEAALDKSLSRSDEQLAYYVAQAREVIDLSMMSQKQIVEDLQHLAQQRGNAGAKAALSDDFDGGLHRAQSVELTVPVWAAFADLMSVLFGAFVLILFAVIGVQLQLSHRLDEAVKQQQQEAQRRKTLKQALAGPLASGRVTLTNGRIGIAGNVLFALNFDQLQPQRRDVLKSFAGPLSAYLGSHDEILMVSGFTDDQQVHEGNRHFADNWELSAKRALTVARADRCGRGADACVRGCVWLATAGQFEQGRGRAREESPSGNFGGAASDEFGGESA